MAERFASRESVPPGLQAQPQAFVRPPEPAFLHWHLRRQQMQEENRLQTFLVTEAFDPYDDSDCGQTHLTMGQIAYPDILELHVASAPGMQLQRDGAVGRSWFRIGEIDHLDTI